MSIFTYFYNKYLEFKYRKNEYYKPTVEDYNITLRRFQQEPQEYLDKGLTQPAIKLISIFGSAGVNINFKQCSIYGSYGGYEQFVWLKAGYIFYVFASGEKREFKAPEKEAYAYIIPPTFKDYCILVNYINTSRIIEEENKKNNFQLKFFKKIKEQLTKEERTN